MTSIHFDKKGQIKGSSDAKNGMAIINMQLSEGGPPCIYNNESFNSVPKKKKSLLFKDSYFKQCEKVKIMGKTF